MYNIHLLFIQFDQCIYDITNTNIYLNLTYFFCTQEIYRIENRLFMIMETVDSYDPEAKAAADKANPRVQDWESMIFSP